MSNLGNRKWWVLVAIACSMLAVSLDMTVLNVALPTLATELNASTSELQWFANAYNLVLAALLLPAGMLGDRYGRKKLMLLALVLFGVASLGCAYSSSTEMLISMRALLGLGSAFLIPLSMSVLPALFSGDERTKAMTIWATANMLGIPLGPILGGWLLKHYSWGSVFLINVPVVIIALLAVGLLMPESRSNQRPSIDLIGIVTSSLGLVCITYGVIRAGDYGWSDSLSILSLIGGLVALAVFIIGQRRAAHSLIDLSLFSYKSFTWGSLLATCITFALFGMLFTLPLFFQAVGGSDSFDTGLRLLPLIVGLIIGAKLADRLIAAIGTKFNVAFGFAIMAIGLLVGSATSIHSSYGFVALWITLTGMGLGLTLPATMGSAISVLSAERAGVGSALIMALRQVGGVIGVALLGSALNYNYRNGLDLASVPDTVADTVSQGVTAGIAVAHNLNSKELLVSVQNAFIHGMGSMLWICGGIAIVSIVLTLIFLPKQLGVSQSESITV
ncbi:MAG: DHA2 family efflux MFS transporter permease subunit [Candidatus Cohnella colombiensis]|uniref:DHA2 family efflux MFS transporter permease subunit n=1 Tax=Candidatus Cohnella colombiensis TaxID=3121368 RepID=A0AA95EXF1_9BACL|nr:MAG: DHA2 family efflux MFS transporter permease subunit [Cohnella sp.]